MKWCNRDLVVSPFHFGLCLSEKKFRKELKALGADEDLPFVRNWHSAASAHTFTRPDSISVIVCMRPAPPGVERIQVYSLLVHEAVHIWQEIKENLGEANPSREFEAYSIQSIAQRLMYAYDNLTKKKKK